MVHEHEGQCTDMYTHNGYVHTVVMVAVSTLKEGGDCLDYDNSKRTHRWSKTCNTWAPGKKKTLPSKHTTLYLSIPADLDWLVVIPRVLEFHTHRELQRTSECSTKQKRKSIQSPTNTHMYIVQVGVSSCPCVPVALWLGTGEAQHIPWANSC